MTDETEAVQTVYSAGWITDDCASWVAPSGAVQPLPAISRHQLVLEDARLKREQAELDAQREMDADNFALAARLQGRPGSGEPWAGSHEEVLARYSRLADAQERREARYAELFEGRRPLAELHADAKRADADAVSARRAMQMKRADDDRTFARLLARHRARRRGEGFGSLLRSALPGGSRDRDAYERGAIAEAEAERRAARYNARTGQYETTV
jgi:hypothetical protein